MKIVNLTIAIFFYSILLVPNITNAQVVHSSYVPSGYQLVFNDEFTDSATKYTNWKPDNRDGRGEEWKTCGVIENGLMRLKNVKLNSVTPSGRAFTAPTCSSIKNFKYGYFECRYKYAASTGFNNSFWLLGSSQLSKDYIEIDINEGQLDEGGKRNMASFIAAGAKPDWDQVRPMTLDHTNGRCTKPAYYYYNMDLSANFHTYGFLWTPDSLIYFFDGKRLLAHSNRRTCGVEPPYRLLNYPMNIYLSIMNDASIPGFAKAVASSMDIDYVRVYQLPGSTDGLPPATGKNLLKNGGFGNYDEEDYGGSMYSWNAQVGNNDSGYYSSTVSAARTSPIFTPHQNINTLQAREYNLTFRARVIDSTNNTAALRLKISNSNNLSPSSITSLVSVSGGGGISGSEVVITKAHAPTFKNFAYRFMASPPSALAGYTRVMFYQNNTAGAATFQLDDVSITPVEPKFSITVTSNRNFTIGDTIRFLIKAGNKNIRNTFRNMRLMQNGNFVLNTDTALIASTNDTITYEIKWKNASVGANKFVIQLNESPNWKFYSDTITVNIGNVLPVKLSNFQITNKACTNYAQWSVFDEGDVAAYNLQHSTNGNVFTDVFNQVPTCTNPSACTYTIALPKAIAETNFYRLVLIEKNGTIVYSPVIKANSCIDKKIALQILPSTIHKNGILKCVYESTETDSSAVLQCYNLKGQLLWQKSLFLQQGKHTVSIPTNLQAGNYLIVLKSKNETVQNKIVVF